MSWTTYTTVNGRSSAISSPPSTMPEPDRVAHFGFQKDCDIIQPVGFVRRGSEQRTWIWESRDGNLGIRIG